MARLLDLPNELLLLITSNLDAIRTFEPQSKAFRLKEKESSRQRENHLRQQALYALCLTSKRLNGIAESLSYSSFICPISFGSRGIRRLDAFARTLTERSDLASCVQYIENRTGDYLGNRSLDGLDGDSDGDPRPMVAEYFNTLGLVICRTPNLVHLSVVSVELADVSLWRNLLKVKQSPSVGMASHLFSKLHTLCFQLQTTPYNPHDEEPVYFRHIADTLLCVPTLQYLCASGVTSRLVTHAFAGRFQSLQTVDISSCMLDLDEVVHMVSACSGLKSFGCHWGYFDEGWNFHLDDLHKALSAHKESLENLHLDVRDVRFWADDLTFRPLGSLRDFTALKSVTICETGLLAPSICLLDSPDQRLPVRISQLLPPSLESFTLFVKTEIVHHDHARIDDVVALGDFVEDCPTALPNLKEVRITSHDRLVSDAMKAPFRQIGINLQLIVD